jgi:hypothetical protein
MTASVSQGTLSCAVEAQVQAPLREPCEERDEGIGIRRARRPEPERRAVAQDDVERGCFGRAHRTHLRSGDRLQAVGFPQPGPRGYGFWVGPDAA